ncbi:MAG: C39 family peptidase [Patescibacteria group bacterium]|nr:C39 family peptidase [Patescibacteria group bacterium]
MIKVPNNSQSNSIEPIPVELEDGVHYYDPQTNKELTELFEPNFTDGNDYDMHEDVNDEDEGVEEETQGNDRPKVNENQSSQVAEGGDNPEDNGGVNQESPSPKKENEDTESPNTSAEAGEPSKTDKSVGSDPELAAAGKALDALPMDEEKKQDAQDALAITDAVLKEGADPIADLGALKAAARQAPKAAKRNLEMVLISIAVMIVPFAIIVVVILAFMGVSPDASYADTLSPTESYSDVPLYKQWDPRWGSEDYGCGGTTIASSGCGITSLAMIISYITQTEVLPPETAKIALDNNWRVCNAGTAYAAIIEMPKMYDINNNKEITWEEAKKYLAAGFPIIQVHGPGYFTEGGHYIVLTGIKDGKYLVNDPDGKHRTEATESQITNSLKHSWVVQK